MSRFHAIKQSTICSELHGEFKEHLPTLPEAKEWQYKG